MPATLDGPFHFLPFGSHDKLAETPAGDPRQEQARKQHVGPEIRHVDEGKDENGVC